MIRNTVENWHAALKSRDTGRLDDLLAEDVTFHSPIVHTPQVGKELTRLYLSAAFFVLANDSFRYVRQVVGERDAVLEFVVEVEGITINGVDMMTWGADGKITDFKVMLRPLKAINLIHQKMAAALQDGARA
jgi:hypothetical protein